MVQLRVVTAAAFLAISTHLLSAQEPAAAAPAGSAPVAAYTNNPKFISAMHDARQYLQQRRPEFAEDEFNQANKIASGKCNECVQGVYDAQVAEKEFKLAIATSERLEAMATTPTEKSIAEYDRGSALYYKAGSKPKPEELQTVHETLQQALAIYPEYVAALYLDGQVLTRMGKMDEAKASFKKSVAASSPTDPSRLLAERFAEDPSLSLKRMAPPFEITTLDGSHFNPAAMSGRVVLIDFWATGSVPSRQDLPMIKKIAKDFAGQPLVILSVSVDNYEEDWKSFIAQNEMTWLQYRDANKALMREFGVASLPRYFLIDADGTLSSAKLDGNSDVEAAVKSLVERAQKRQNKAQQTTGGS